MGNRVPIDKEEMLDYVIDGIPDKILQNQARIQRFETMSDLQEAFEKVALSDKNTSKVEKTEKRNGNRVNSDFSKKGTTSEEVRDKRCFICGERDHLSDGCPTKERGPKCFECGERGHIAAKCVVKKTVAKSSCAVEQSGRRKCLEAIVTVSR